MNLEELVKLHRSINYIEFILFSDEVALMDSWRPVERYLTMRLKEACAELGHQFVEYDVVLPGHKVCVICNKLITNERNQATPSTDNRPN